MLGLGAACRFVSEGSKLFTPLDISRTEYLKQVRENNDVLGLLVAGGLMCTWCRWLFVGLFRWDITLQGLPTSVALAAFNTWLYAGIFITAHDAMHGVVCPHVRWLNNLIGWLCVKCYAFFDYQLLVHCHWAHHRSSGVPFQDPDFHDGECTGFWAWYCHFMKAYVTCNQLAGMAVISILLFRLGSPIQNMCLFWVAPSLLSSLQLFYFGTYKPHHGDDDQFPDRHHARTDYSRSALWHFVTCFNFGLHHEHHVFPWCPWWKLPLLRGALKEKGKPM